MSEANNQLKVAERYKLFKWWESVAAQCDGKSSSEIAAEATKALGFHVTGANMLTAYKVTSLKPKNVSGRKPGGNPSADRTRFLARQIVEIRKALDMGLHPYLLSIATGGKEGSTSGTDR